MQTEIRTIKKVEEIEGKREREEKRQEATMLQYSTVHIHTHKMNEREQPHAYKNASKLITMNDENQNKTKKQKKETTIHYIPSTRTECFERTYENNRHKKKWTEKKKTTNIRLRQRTSARCVEFSIASEFRAESGKRILGNSIRFVFT